MNLSQRFYLAFALVAVLFTFNPTKVAALDCTYHWDNNGKVPGRACEHHPKSHINRQLR
jgi:hypothetical protein